jgi:hypothetical protein
MHLDAVEARRLGVLRRRAEAGDDARQLGVVQHARHDVGLFALRRMHGVVGDRQGAGTDRLFAVVEQRMAGAAAVPDLQEDAAAGGMHGVGDQLPAGDLGRAVDPRLAPEGGVALDRHGRLGDQQAGAGALGVVLGHQGIGDMLLAGAAARQRRHENAVRGVQGPQFEFAEKSGHGVGPGG